MMNRIKTYVSHARVLFAALVVTFFAALVGVVYGFQRDDYNFLDNLIATTIGVLFGFVVGLVTNSIQTSEQKLAAGEAVTARLRDVLGRIQTELEYNLTALQFRQTMLQENASGDGEVAVMPFYMHRLKVELWDALRAGGELEFVSDLGTLEAITTAYHKLRTIALMEEHTLRRYDMGAKSEMPRPLMQEGWELLRLAQADVEAALAAIKSFVGGG